MVLDVVGQPPASRFIEALGRNRTGERQIERVGENVFDIGRGRGAMVSCASCNLGDDVMKQLAEAYLLSERGLEATNVAQAILVWTFAEGKELPEVSVQKGLLAVRSHIHAGTALTGSTQVTSLFGLRKVVDVPGSIARILQEAMRLEQSPIRARCRFGGLVQAG